MGGGGLAGWKDEYVKDCFKELPSPKDGYAIEDYTDPRHRRRVVTSDVFRENHVRKTSSGRVRTSPLPDERLSRPTAGGRRRRTAQADGPWRTAQVDGPSGRPVLRQSAQPPYRKTARNIITFFSPLQGSPSSTMAPRVTPQSYFLL
jgi:hypothetical protein